MSITITRSKHETIKDEGSVLVTDASAINFVGTGVTATESGGVVTVTIPAAGSGISSINSTIFYVRLDGSDITGDGSIAKPFLTIDAAIAATVGITLDQGYGPGVLDLDATWEINVGPGSFPCDTPMKNFVYLKGAGWQNTFVFPNINPTNTWDCVDAPGTEARFGATGIQFINGFEMIRPSGSVEPARARFFGCLFSSNSTFTGSGTGQDAVSFNECEMFGSVITYGAIGVTHRNGSLGVSTFGDVGVDASFSGSNATLVHTTHRRITINNNALVVLRNSPLTSQNVVFNGTGGVLRTFDENSVPTAVALNGGATAAQVQKNARVGGLGVNGNTGMTTAGNWVGAPPVDFNNALNRLIDSHVTLNGTPIGDITTRVAGPSASLDNELPVFDSTTGKLIKQSGATLSNDVANVYMKSTAAPIDGDNGKNLLITGGNALQEDGTSGVAGSLRLQGGLEVDAITRAKVYIDGELNALLGAKFPNSITTNVLNLTDADSSDYVRLFAPSVTTQYDIVFPPAQGAADTILQNDGSGGLTWEPTSGNRISAVLTTRVTDAPNATGEYRTYQKDAVSNTGTNDAPTSAPSSSNGMRIYAKNYATAGTSGETNRWEIFVGTGKKNVRFQFYLTTGFSGSLNTNPYYYGTTVVYGILTQYDPTTGIACVDTIEQAAAVTSRVVGSSFANAGAAPNNPTDCYFDIFYS